ncbi:MAG: hypothetical protein WDN04_14610, partial [Rhodospirillales bacterium]
APSADGGQVVTLEFSPDHARVARENIARAGLSHVVTVHVGRGTGNASHIGCRSEVRYDFHRRRINAATPITSPGRLNFRIPERSSSSNNVVRDGAVLEASSSDPDVQGIRRLFDMLAAEPRLTATALQTVGKQGLGTVSPLRS